LWQSFFCYYKIPEKGSCCFQLELTEGNQSPFYTVVSPGLIQGCKSGQQPINLYRFLGQAGKDLLWPTETQAPE
jgi:hypothetical protein